MKHKKFQEMIKAGILIGASLIIMSSFIILIGGGKFFEKFDNYKIMVKNSAGLEVGSQVRLGGVRVGRVGSISEPAGPGEPVIIEIGLRKGTKIYKGTKAMVSQVGFVGDLYLLLAVDATTNELIPPGGTIPAVESVDFSVLMSRVDTLSQSVDGLVKDVNKVFSEKNVKGIEDLVANTNKAIVTTSDNIDQVTKSLTTTAAKLDRVLTEVEALVTDNKGEITELIKKARVDLERAEDMIESFAKTAKTVDRTVEVQSMNLDSLLNTMTRTTEELENVIQDLKAKPWSIIYKEKGD
ncbi:MAG: hypothetical protein OHK006_14700 [Thermodesulfovibrionales bacterium]